MSRFYDRMLVQAETRGVGKVVWLNTVRAVNLKK